MSDHLRSLGGGPATMTLVDRALRRRDAEAMDVLRGIAMRQAERHEALLVECANCDGVGWHAEVEVEVHGVTMAAGGDCPVCLGKGKVLPSSIVTDTAPPLSVASPPLPFVGAAGTPSESDAERRCDWLADADREEQER